MSMRGGLGAGFLVAVIVLFCFSIRLGRRFDDSARLAPEESLRPIELRLMCQPSQPPDPTLHRPHPPEHDDDPPALNVRARAHDDRLALTQ